MFIKMSLLFAPKGPITYAIASGNSLAPYKRQAIIWTYGVVVYLRIYASLGLGHLDIVITIYSRVSFQTYMPFIICLMDMQGHNTKILDLSYYPVLITCVLCWGCDECLSRCMCLPNNVNTVIARINNIVSAESMVSKMPNVTNRNTPNKSLHSTGYQWYILPWIWNNKLR